jgi:hypothetical protein
MRKDETKAYSSMLDLNPSGFPRIRVFSRLALLLGVLALGACSTEESTTNQAPDNGDEGSNPGGTNPSVTASGDPLNLQAGEVASFAWQAENAEFCQIGGDGIDGVEAANELPTEGTFPIEQEGFSEREITITCTDDGGNSAEDSVIFTWETSFLLREFRYTFGVLDAVSVASGIARALRDTAPEVGFGNTPFACDRGQVVMDTTSLIVTRGPAGELEGLEGNILADYQQCVLENREFDGSALLEFIGQESSQSVTRNGLLTLSLAVADYELEVLQHEVRIPTDGTTDMDNLAVFRNGEEISYPSGVAGERGSGGGDLLTEWRPADRLPYFRQVRALQSSYVDDAGIVTTTALGNGSKDLEFNVRYHPGIYVITELTRTIPGPNSSRELRYRAQTGGSSGDQRANGTYDIFSPDSAEVRYTAGSTNIPELEPFVEQSTTFSPRDEFPHRLLYER